MLHPSYSDLMRVVNAEVEPGETKVVNSRYSIVVATAKRARQIVNGEEPLVPYRADKPLSIAVEELNQGKIKIIAEDELEDYENEVKKQAAAMEQEMRDNNEEIMIVEEDVDDEQDPDSDTEEE